MIDLAGDKGLFIRSMASRGNPGGLAAATADAVDVLDAFGVDVVIVETVGAGQTEVEVVALADTICLVLTPESGDSVQAMKAGLMEIGDIYVVNKADRPGADRLVREIQASREDESADSPPLRVIETVAVKGEGIQDLREAIEAHRQQQTESGRWGERRKEAVRRRIASIVERKLHQAIWHGERRKALDEATEKVLQGGETPHQAARRVLRGD